MTNIQKQISDFLENNQRRQAYLIGFVSLFFWLFARFIPIFKLLTPDGHPLSGLGVVFTIFNEQYLCWGMVVISSLFLIALSYEINKIRVITETLIFMMWIMTSTAYLFWTSWHLTLHPNLVLHFGYVVAVWFDLKEQRL